MNRVAIALPYFSLKGEVKMNVETLQALEEIKQMIADGDEKVKKELKNYVDKQMKDKKVKSTKKDGD